MTPRRSIGHVNSGTPAHKRRRGTTESADLAALLFTFTPLASRRYQRRVQNPCRLIVATSDNERVGWKTEPAEESAGVMSLGRNDPAPSDRKCEGNRGRVQGWTSDRCRRGGTRGQGFGPRILIHAMNSTRSAFEPDTPRVSRSRCGTVSIGRRPLHWTSFGEVRHRRAAADLLSCRHPHRKLSPR
jgi:hypothetical protein